MIEEYETEDDLCAYRKKINRLSENDQILRDLYLKKLANGTLQGPQTFSAYINRTHTKFFTEEEIMSSVENVSAYQLIKNDVVFEELNYTAINYFDFKISYKELFDKIDLLASMLIKSNVKRGDTISVCLPNIPEAIYIFFAINKIGAIANMIDVRYKNEQLCDCINDSNSKIIFIFDNNNDMGEPNPLEELDKVIDKTKLSMVIKIELIESLSPIIKKIIKIKLKQKSNIYSNYSRYISFNDALNMGCKKDKINSVYFEEVPALYEHTSGSTGMPKTVALSNKSFTGVINGYDNFGMRVNPGDVFLNLIPPFMAYGIIPSITYPLCKKMEVVLIPTFEEEKFYDQLIKYRPAFTNATKMHWGYVKTIVEEMEEKILHLNSEVEKIRSILRDNIMDISDYRREKKHLKKVKKALRNEKEKYDKVDFSYLKIAGIGGDFVSAEFERQMNLFLKKHGCKYTLCKGYGMTEVGSTFVASSGLNNHGDGSVGIPFIKNSVMIYDYARRKEMYYDNTGEIFLSGPSIAIGYVKNEDANKSTLIEIDGKKWIRTGDIGFLNRDGELTVKGRIKRLIIINGGDKISPDTIENVIEKLPMVKDVCVIGLPDKIRGNIVKAHIILKADVDNNESAVIEQIKAWCGNLLSINLVPSKYQIDREFPKTPAGKIDIDKIIRQDIADSYS